ncbi:hypothetical protein SprV_0602187200 [Sparganum proliferum]
MVTFYRQFLSKCADLMLPLTNMPSDPKGPLELTDWMLTVFQRIKAFLVDVALLTNPALESRPSLTIRAPQKLRPNKPLPDIFRSLDTQSSHVHLDVVGPCVGRYTRWAEVIPLQHVETDIIVKALVSRRAAIFAASSTATTEWGAQFKSAFFEALLSFLGCSRIRKTAYHAEANGMVESLHRQLMTALRAAEDPVN